MSAKPDECLVCMENAPSKSIAKVSPSCQHKMAMCDTCILQHIKTQLSGDRMSLLKAISCPHPKCGATLQSEFVLKML